MSERISIIIPAYNAGEYIGSSVGSVLDQGYGDIEILVVDDGSKDDTAERVKELAAGSDAVKLIKTENFGVSHARNTGLDNCTGEYVVFLDADDELIPGALEFLHSKLMETGADIVCGGMTSDRNCLHGPDYCTVLNGTETLEAALAESPSFWSVCGKIYKKEITEKTRFNETLRVNEDLDFNIFISIKEPRMTICGKKVYFYRDNPFSASRSAFSDKFLDPLKAEASEHEAVLKKYPEMEANIKDSIVKRRLTLLYNLAGSPFSKKYRETEKQCLRLINENRKYFRPVTPKSRLLFFIIRLRLYYLYKIIKHLRLYFSSFRQETEKLK